MPACISWKWRWRCRRRLILSRCRPGWTSCAPSIFAGDRQSAAGERHCRAAGARQSGYGLPVLDVSRRPMSAACASTTATAAGPACATCGRWGIANLVCWRDRKFGFRPSASASWREALHSLNIARSTTVFGDWSAASGWQKTFELLHAATDQRHSGGKRSDGARRVSALAQLNRSGSQAVSVTGYDDTADGLTSSRAHHGGAGPDLLGKGRWSG